MPASNLDLVRQAEAFRPRLVSFLQDLVRLPSVNGRDTERAVGQRVKQEALRLGLESELHGRNPARPNVLAGWGRGGSGFVLIGHMDTVAEGAQPWKTPPFEARIRNGKMIGRGTADNKAGLACGLYTLALLKENTILDPDKVRVMLAGVVDEESGASSPDGLRFLLDQELLTAAGAIYTYASDIVCIGHRGLLRFWLEAEGRSVHSGSREWARGEMGVNAATGLAQALLALEQLHLPAPEGEIFDGLGLTVTPGTQVTGGEFESMVPSRARAAVDIRIPPGRTGDEVLALVEDTLSAVRKSRPGLQFKVIVKNKLPPAMIAPRHPLARLAQQHARSLTGREWPVRIAGPANEGYMLIEAGIPTLCGFGPTGGNAHAPDEWVSLDSLPLTVAIYAAVIRDYLEVI